MCGIFGLINRKGSPDIVAGVVSMLNNNVARGKEGCGLVAFPKGLWLRAEGDPSKVTSKPEWKEVEEVLKESPLVIGHTRKVPVTVNTNTGVEFLHPVLSQNKNILVHNGVVSPLNKEDLEGITFYTGEGPDISKISDSEILVNLIDKFGIEALGDHVEGSIAFIYYKRDSEEIYLLRNKERPLFIGMSNGSIIIGSDADYVNSAYRVMGYKEKNWYGLFSPFRIVAIPENKIIRIPLDKLVPEIAGETAVKSIEKTYAGYAYGSSKFEVTKPAIKKHVASFSPRTTIVKRVSPSSSWEEWISSFKEEIDEALKDLQFITNIKVLEDLFEVVVNTKKISLSYLSNKGRTVKDNVTIGNMNSDDWIASFISKHKHIREKFIMMERFK